ncbi:hypothetical protein [Pseudomonas proteolytica]|uniref:hypothetical protein n=1 Tax=Pseudomonas proteolytica TaxID=219574 RepID=UPI0032084BA1
MRISFPPLATFTAVLCLALAIAWGLRPDWLLWLWDVEFSEASGLVARRNAMLFLAIGVMFYRLRHTPPSLTRSALVSGFIVGCLGLAVLGIGEWLNGHAGPGILLAVGTELALGLGFIQARNPAVS